MNKTLSIETSFFPDLVENSWTFWINSSVLLFIVVKVQDWIRKEKNNKIKLIHKKIFNISQNDVTGVKDTKQFTKSH